MFGKETGLIKATVSAFLADGALSHGATIAYYSIFSIAPILLIVVAIAGLVFGRDAAQGAIVAQLSGLMGQQSAEALQSMLKSASSTSSGTLATIIGIVTLLLTASGVFGEMQTSLNAIWKAQPRSSTASRLVRARIVSLGLVMVLGARRNRGQLPCPRALARCGLRDIHLVGKGPGALVAPRSHCQPPRAEVCRPHFPCWKKARA